MSTFKQVVDRISNTMKSLNKDDRISKRYILKVFQDKLEFLLAQKLRDRTLFREDGLYTKVECVELENIDTYSCDIVDFKSCNSIMRGTKQLPKIINSLYGPGVRNVTNIDDTMAYSPTTPSKYRKSKLREEPLNSKQYYIQNGYPYLPNSKSERINMEILTLEPYLLSRVAGCNTDKCKSYWDYDLPTSDKLTEAAVGEALKELGFSKQIQEDEDANMKRG